MTIRAWLDKAEAQLVSDWRDFWRWWSLRVMVLLGASADLYDLVITGVRWLIEVSPDLHQGLISLGWADATGAPDGVKWTVRILGLIAVLSRLKRQRKP